MVELKERIRKGARLLAVAGAYVPAVHCHNPQGTTLAVDEPTEPAAAEPSGPPTEPAASPEPATPPMPAQRPGAGSTAECRFLEQISLAAGPRSRSAPRLRSLVLVQETYGRFSGSLGEAYGGQMGAAATVRSAGATLVFSVEYTPTEEPWASRYERVTVNYQLPLSGPSAPARGSRQVEARVSAVGQLRGGGTEPAGTPATCRVRSRAGDSGDCAYPRWNPRGMRYGLLSTIEPEDED